MKFWAAVKGIAVTATLMATLLMPAGYAFAEYNREPDSAIDLTMFDIDQMEYLGSRVDGEYTFIDQYGKELKVKEFIGKPFILVLSYYKCDGVCSAVNGDLIEFLKGFNRTKVGEDFNILTLSFDKFDTPETQRDFISHLKMPKRMEDGWTFGVAKDPEAIKEFTNSFGFKYFWSPRDKTFFHPNVYIFITPEGRIGRYLYSSAVESKDVELAVMEVNQEKVKPTRVADYIVSYCYSYNYKEGKYTLNIPLFVALGSLGIGVSAFAFSAVYYKTEKNKKG